MVRALHTGDRIGEYEVLDRIAEGGMGFILRARHRLMNRVVVIKVSKLTSGDEDRVSKMFRREIEASARLSHPNVLTVFDAGMVDGQPFLVTEYVPGGDLERRIRNEGYCSVTEAIDFIIQAATGLQAIHDCGIIHRDVKPANLLVDERGSVQILDFGISKLTTVASTPAGNSRLMQETIVSPGPMTESATRSWPAVDYEPQRDSDITVTSGAPDTPVPAQRTEQSFIDHVFETEAMATIFSHHVLDTGTLTTSHKVAPLPTSGSPAPAGSEKNPNVPTKNFSLMAGTPAYMSPEQWVSASNVDVRTDVYALGCTLFFLLTGEIIVDGNSRKIVSKKRAGKTRVPSELRKDVPPGLDAIVRRMTAVSPADRFESMDRVRLALEQTGAEPQVFISYRREDSLDATDRLYAGLAQTIDRKSLFLDVDSIPAGVDFRDHITSAVGSCDVVLVVIGDYWLQPRRKDGARRIDDPADFVRLEIQSALTQKLPVIPVLVGRAQMPAARDLPETLEALVFKNAAEVRAGSSYSAHVDQLLQDIFSIWKGRRTQQSDPADRF